jgi:hypothetical protein
MAQVIEAYDNYAIPPPIDESLVYEEMCASAPDETVWRLWAQHNGIDH